MPLAISEIASGQIHNQPTASTGSMIAAEFNQSAIPDSRSVTKVHTYKAIQLADQSLTLRVSEDFGSYVIPQTNYLVLAPTDKGSYDRAQMVNKVTGEFLFSLYISRSLNTIDMSGTKPGTYRIVLTNAQGEKYVEDIMIM